MSYLKRMRNQNIVSKFLKELRFGWTEISELLSPGNGNRIVHSILTFLRGLYA